MAAIIVVSSEENRRPKNFFLSTYIFLRSSFDEITGGSASFIISLINYLYTRLRATYLYIEVGAKVISNLLNDFKDFAVNNLFWGRSAKYRWVVQLGVIALAGIFTMTQIYKQPQLVVNAQEVDFDSISVAENDLIVESGSTQTLIPKSRGRLDTIAYEVQPGDNLSSIATQFGLKVSTIVWSNGMSSSKQLIKPGQILKIPEGDGVLHTVQKGDTLVSIAKRYNSNEQAIASINWLDSPSSLKVGEVLFVPDGQIVITPPSIASVPKPSGGGGSVQIPGGGGGPDPVGISSLVWPVAGGIGTVTQCPSWYHKAVDIASKLSPNLVAARSGVVVFAGIQDPYGYAREVIISHGNGLYTQYAHLSAWAVKTGDVVSAGQVIGRMGRSGAATGIHLHFEVRSGGSSYKYRVAKPQNYLVRRVCR